MSKDPEDKDFEEDEEMPAENTCPCGEFKNPNRKVCAACRYAFS